jgi:hypothetical protein
VLAKVAARVLSLRFLPSLNPDGVIISILITCYVPVCLQLNFVLKKYWLLHILWQCLLVFAILLLFYVVFYAKQLTLYVKGANFLPRKETG